MSAENPDRAFLRYLEKGDAEAFAAFYDQTLEDVLAVALRLAPDAARAEDLVQGTYLAALERNASFDRSQRVVPWLVGICTNLARRHYRTRQREAAPPAAAPVGEPDPLAAAERSEVREALARSIAKLPELYRPVLVLNLEHELTPTEIARALGRPAVTVRSQLFRGLELLRDALPRGIAFGALVALLPTRGLAAVREIVLAKAALGGTALALLPASGGILVVKKLVAALVVALFVSFLVATRWIFFPAPEATLVSDAGIGKTPAPVASRPASVEASLPASLPRQAMRSAEPGALASVRVKLVWKRDGAAAVGVRGVLRERARPVARLHEREFETDAFGVFACEGLVPGEIEVLTDRSSHQITLARGEHAEKQLAIPVGLEVTVRVVDLDKRPIPGAEIWCSSSHDWNEGCVAGRTDARGTFVLRDLGLRRSLAARAPGYEPAVTARLEGEPGQRVEEEIVLQRGGASLRGTVRLPDGRPAARALVRIATNMSRQVDPVGGGFHPPPPATDVRTDAAGAFQVDGLPSSLLTTTARSTEGGIASKQIFVKAGESEVVHLQVSEAIVVPGRVRSSHGSAVAGATVTALWRDLGSLSRTDAITDGEGRFVLAGTPVGDVTFQVAVERRWSNHEAVVAPGMAPLELAIVMPDRGERVAGRVVGEDGSPCVAWCVRSLPRPGRMFQTSTDAEGGFAFDECPEPTTTLQVGGPAEHAFVPLVTLEGVARGRTDLRIVVPKERAVFGTLRLRVLGPDRTGLPRVLVRLVADDGERVIDHQTGPDGKVEIPQLPRGRYRVSVRAAGFGVVSLGVRELAGAEGLDLGTVLLAPAVTLRARIEGPGLEGGHAYAAIYTQDGEYIAPQSPRSTATELVFENVPPGEYVAPIGGLGIAVQRIAVHVGAASDQVVVWRVEKGRSVTLRARGCALLSEYEFTVLDTGGNALFTFRNRCIDASGSLQVGVSLAVGTYAVRLRELGGAVKEEKLTVPAANGLPLQVDLALR